MVEGDVGSHQVLVVGTIGTVLAQPTDWWTPFVDKLVVPRLVSQFVAISVIPLHEGYDMFDMLLTRWKPIVSPE